MASLSLRQGTVLTLLLALCYYPFSALYARLQLFGAFRSTFPSVHSFPAVLETKLITEIRQAEDLVYHEPSRSYLFASQGNTNLRWGWWPAWANFDRPEGIKAAAGELWMLNADSWETTRIPHDLPNPFDTHGIDIFPSPDCPSHLYLLAVNHRASLDPSGKPLARANSTIEIFKVDLSIPIAKHIRTVSDPLVYTPNDIYAIGPGEFLVTNDHVNRDGLLRTLEDTFTLKLTSRTDIVHVKADLTDARKGVAARVVLGALHNANGLGHGPGGEILLGDAAGGVLSVLDQRSNGDLEIQSAFQTPSTIDNPTYFHDPYVTPGSNASAYVLGGMLKGWDLDYTCRNPNALNPSVVWLARRRSDGEWHKKLLFEDDGSWLNGAATAHLLAIKPDGSGPGRREAWVVATGPFARGVSVARVDITDWAAA